jgi:creatinine amidohydrolase
MFPDELEQRFEACPVAYLTYGLCEPHGPQNAVGLDGLKAHAIACRAARAHGGIVAPPYWWHVHEVGGYAAWAHERVGQVARKWLTAEPPWVHFRNVCYHVRAVEQVGFHAAILITGHYGPNWKDLKTVVGLLQPHLAVRLWALPDFEANQPGFDGDGKSGGDHAGKVETSLLWALEPENVDVSRIPRDKGQHFAMGPDASESSRLTGERMVADEVRWLGVKAQELLSSWVERPRGLERFDDVERFWEAEIAPRVRGLESMQLRFNERGAVPEESVWQANWKVSGPR